MPDTSIIVRKGNPADAYVIPADCFYMAYRGSVAHGTYRKPEDGGIDDVDLMGFCIGPRETYLGLKEWGGKGTKETKEGSFDVVLYEIRKAFRLLLQGNPNILTMLWVTPEFALKKNDSAERLINNRHLFLGKHIHAAFAGYAYAQLQKMESRDPAELREYLAVTAELKFRGCHPTDQSREFEIRLFSGEAINARETSTEKLLQKLKGYQKKGENLGYLGEKRKQSVLEHGFDRKNASHLIRLLRQCIEIMNTGEMIVDRTPIDAQELVDIKKGNGWPLEDVKRLSSDLFQQAKSARDASKLPDGPDVSEAQGLLVSILERELGYCPF